MAERDDVGEPIKPRKPKREDTEMDITPMIDMTFLLLSFFVVCSKMDPTTAVDMPKAFYGEAISEKDSVVLIVSVGKTKDDFEIYRGRGKEDNSRVAETEPLAQEDAVARYVQQELSAHPDIQTIIIKAEAAVKTGAVETIKRGIAQAELAEGRRIYVGVEELQ